ncbi:LytTR family DNA-binding domain-containing protein [Flagellimonas myxillae]|uniref:LytTR family DNA-binding domain-containing protein n=1 Tax=Flagellimonas myxillae TaxID=2942214 RepID=UPI00201F925E|nr:LytTR family DNA-binding domain-containing protein [Muricauda myxillae]MCL6266339.1 LytTR family transcriptional regulator DNA-binding domain-containing protein [Muricauda myxillae]
MREATKTNQDLLFKRPYIWIVTLSVTSLNFLITYNFENLDVQHIYYYLVDVLTTYLCIEFYAMGIHWMNKRVPLYKDFVKRVTFQLTLHTLSVIICTLLLNELFDHLFFEGQRLSLSFVFYTKDTLVALLFILLLHMIYFGLFLLSNKQNQESLHLAPDTRIKLKDAFTFKLLDQKEIIGVYSLLGITYVVDTGYNKFSSELTLKEMEALLGNRFFRANRKFILSKTIIDAFESGSYGKIEVSLKTHNIVDLPQKIVVSRDKAAQFRTWISGDSY